MVATDYQNGFQPTKRVMDMLTTREHSLATLRDSQEAMEAFRACGDWSAVEEAYTQWLGHISRQIKREEREQERRLAEQERSAQQQDKLHEAVESALYFQ